MRIAIKAKHIKIILAAGILIWSVPIIVQIYQTQEASRLQSIENERYEGQAAEESVHSDSKSKMAGPEKETASQGLDADTLRIVHLDLKGAPPLMSYLKEWVKLVAQAGCTAILIEYEDMFPFDGILRNVSAKNAYSKTEILELQELCDELSIEVIPLVQTFGHMEYVLKLPDFMNLREVPQYPEVICPSKIDSVRVVKEIIRQVMAVHRTAKWIHIGCDEVYHLKMCSVCSASTDTPSQVFEKHVITIASFIESNYPEVKTLIWDDMMRSWLPGYFAISKLRHWIEPVVWIYGVNIDGSLPNWVWFWYAKVFPKIWIAGSFKGATGELAILPNLTFHLENQLSWILFLKESVLIKHTKISGIILTGWSRYDHFAGLCELLPPATPSLMISLQLIKNAHKNSVTVHKSTEYKNFILKKATSLLKCNSPTGDISLLNVVSYENCSFMGHLSYFIMKEYIEVEIQIKGIFEDFTEKNAWLTAVNRNENFTSPYRIWSRFHYDDWIVANKRAAALEKFIRSDFKNYFDEYTIEEWFQQRVKPLYVKLDEMKKITDVSLKQSYWPRRPLVDKPFQIE